MSPSSSVGTHLWIYHRLEKIFLTSGPSHTCSKHMRQSQNWVWKLHPTKLSLHSVLVTRIPQEVVSDPPITEAHPYFRSQCLVISIQQSSLRLDHFLWLQSHQNTKSLWRYSFLFLQPGSTQCFLFPFPVFSVLCVPIHADLTVAPWGTKHDMLKAGEQGEDQRP